MTDEIESQYDPILCIEVLVRAYEERIAGIEDIEYLGENVWGPGGMVAYLQERKADGRLGGIYCSTHGRADDVIRLIDTGVFDTIMLAWNPLGFSPAVSSLGAAENRQELRGRFGPYRTRSGARIVTPGRVDSTRSFAPSLEMDPISNVTAYCAAKSAARFPIAVAIRSSVARSA